MSTSVHPTGTPAPATTDECVTKENVYMTKIVKVMREMLQENIQTALDGVPKGEIKNWIVRNLPLGLRTLTLGLARVRFTLVPVRSEI